MDPLSVAGLGLGASSLVFQLFAGCVKGFVLLSTAHNLGKDSSTLLCMLNLQELQLTEWARRAGLLSGNHELDRRLNVVVVQSVLKELESLLLDTEKLKSRYRLGLKAIAISTDAITPVDLLPIGGALGIAISDQIRRDIMFQAGLIQDRNNFTQRLRWAAVDKAKFEEYIGQIRLFIQELWNLLDPFRHDEMVSGLEMVLSHVIGMSRQVDELTALKETLQHPSVVPSLSSSVNERSPLASVADIRAMGMSIGAVSGQSLSTSPAALPPLPTRENSSARLTQGSAGGSVLSSKAVVELAMASIQDFVAIQGNPKMGIAKYNGEVVFIEWKQLPVFARSKIMARVQDLAILLSAPKHSSFRALKCKGLARDSDAPRIAFIFEMPPAPMGFQPPRPLRTMFRGCPSVTQRLDLALKITQSVRFFHMSGWLHKNLQSSNILILVSGEQSGYPKHQLACPRLAGFAFSRLDSASEISEQPSSDPQRDIYRHPEAMGDPSESFSAIKDIYALGTILLEIGEWRSLKSLVERIVNVGKSNVALSQLVKIKPFLLNEETNGGLATLRFRMGEVYASVTKMMLSGEIPQVFRETQSPGGTKSSGETKSLGELFAPNLLDVAIRELTRCII